jgi:gamma-glutamylcyclotransferase (GGCT)/AIG2-like uncharacterized protein YtfP
MLIGVYGTLKKNHYNHPLISRSNGRFVKTVKIPYYKMYSLGYYPILIPSQSQDDRVLVEIYDVSEEAYKRMRAMELGAGYVEIDQPIGGIIVKMWIYPSIQKVRHWGPELVPDGVWTLDLENDSISKLETDKYDKYDFNSLGDIELDYEDFEPEQEKVLDSHSWLDDNDDYDNDDYIFLRELDDVIDRDKDKDEFATFDPTVACDCELDGVKPSWIWDKNLQVWRCEKCNTTQE